MARWAPTPLRPSPRGSLVAAMASTPPKSRPSRPMWPRASILGAPCWPLHCMISEVNDRWPSKAGLWIVLAWVASSLIENGGLTLAIRRVLVPHRGEVEEPRALDLPDEVLDTARV